SGEEAHDRSRAAGGVSLAPAEPLEDRVARVLLRPDARQTTRVVVDLVRDQALGRGVVGAVCAGPALLARVAGCGIVRVGIADEAELPRIDSPPLLESQAVLQRVPDHATPRIRRDRRRREAVEPLVRDRELLEVAQLVVGADAHAREAIEAALRVALHLMDLGERLEELATQRLLGSARILPLPPLAEIRVVRDDDGVAASVGVQAVALDGVPDALRHAVGRGLELAVGERRHLRVAEDDVAMEVTTERARRVFVPDEAGEGAPGGAVVRLLRCSLDGVPHRHGGAVAVHAGLGAEGQRRWRVLDTRGKSHWTIVRNCVCGVSTERNIWQMSKSYGTEPGVAHSSDSPKNSEWSVTAAKSSGRSRRAVRVGCSLVSEMAMGAPFAKAYASCGSARVP